MNAGVHHAVPFHAEQEDTAVVRPVRQQFRDGKHALDVFCRKDGRAGGHAADQRRALRAAAGCIRLSPWYNGDGAPLGVIAPDQAGGLHVVQVHEHRGGGRQPDALAYLPDGGRATGFLHVAQDELIDLLLWIVQFLHAGTAFFFVSCEEYTTRAARMQTYVRKGRGIR